jgi:hypothetical protein
MLFLIIQLCVVYKGSVLYFLIKQILCQLQLANTLTVLWKGDCNTRGADKSLARPTSLSNVFFQSREQVVVRRDQIRSRGWVITHWKPGLASFFWVTSAR